MEDLNVMLQHIATILDITAQPNCIIVSNAVIWTEIRKSSIVETTDRIVIISNTDNTKKIEIGFHSPNLKEKIKAAIELLK